jgi:hypothetical protein
VEIHDFSKEQEREVMSKNGMVERKEIEAKVQQEPKEDQVEDGEYIYRIRGVYSHPGILKQSDSPKGPPNNKRSKPK